jgi:hypothetical protein
MHTYIRIYMHAYILYIQCTYIHIHNVRIYIGTERESARARARARERERERERDAGCEAKHEGESVMRQNKPKIIKKQ